MAECTENIEKMDADTKKELDKNFYTIVAPKTFRPNSNFDLTLTLHDSENVLSEPCVAKISIRDEDDENKHNNEQLVPLTVNTTKVLSIPIGDVPADANYKLVAECVSGLKFKHEASLNIESKNYALMIQTDKAMYKASDVVRFRVLVLDAQLRPAELGSTGLNVHITVCKLILW